MSNPLTEKLVTGTVGELIVQLRFLQFDVQAAPPLKDTGNDLIAIRRGVIHTVQIKTSKDEDYPVSDLPEYYTLLAAVHLDGHDNILDLESTKIYLIRRSELDTVPRQFRRLGDYELSQARVDKLFGGALSAKERGPALDFKRVEKQRRPSSTRVSSAPLNLE